MITEEEQETLDTYNQIAENWTATAFHPDFWQEEYLKFQKLVPAGKILDIGCGSGRDSLFFTDHGYDYTGIDASSEMIRLSKEKNPKAEFILKDFYSLDFPAESFDGFWAACSLLHAPKNKVAGILADIKKIIKKNAIGLISIKEGEGEKLEEYKKSGHKRLYSYYSQNEFKEILETAGFEVLEMDKRQPPEAIQGDTFLVYFVKSI